ncbi:uncharacterized protein LOC120832286 [Gasterosteus aculeatus]
MIGKILSHLLWNAEDDFGATTDTNAELMEFEEGGWVIVVPASTGMKTDVFELGRVARTAGGLLMTEHPSTSVYQMRRGTQEEQVPPRGASRPAAVRRRLAAWGVPLPCGAQRLAVQRARTRAERKQLSRAALHRQNLAGMRSSPGGRRRGSYERLGSR